MAGALTRRDTQPVWDSCVKVYVSIRHAERYHATAVRLANEKLFNQPETCRLASRLKGKLEPKRVCLLARATQYKDEAAAKYRKAQEAFLEIALDLPHPERVPGVSFEKIVPAVGDTRLQECLHSVQQMLFVIWGIHDNNGEEIPLEDRSHGSYPSDIITRLSIARDRMRYAPVGTYISTIKLVNSSSEIVGQVWIKRNETEITCVCLPKTNVTEPLNIQNYIIPFTEGIPTPFQPLNPCYYIDDACVKYEPEQKPKLALDDESEAEAESKERTQKLKISSLGVILMGVPGPFWENIASCLTIKENASLMCVCRAMVPVVLSDTVQSQLAKNVVAAACDAVFGELRIKPEE